MMRDPLHPEDEPWRDLLARPLAACVMGRNMFGPVRGDWDRDWRGWWGEDPPYHCPVFVLTHHPHDPIEMAGGTTFHFVDGFDEAMAAGAGGRRARRAAADRRRCVDGAAGAARRRARRAHARRLADHAGRR